VWAEGEAGDCQDSGIDSYPFVYIGPVPGNPAGDEAALSGWCKSWCEQVHPELVVGISTYDNGSNTECYCHFSDDNKPSPFDNNLLTLYEPDASGLNGLSGTGCIGGTDDNPRYKCYRKCAYNQCVSIFYACLS
jgi:hypothetical protein